MKIILDENLPKPLKDIFAGHLVSTVQEEGQAGTVNGALLALLEGMFDVFLTADRNLRYQQNLSGRTLAIIELPTNRLPLLRPLFARIVAAVESITPGEYVALSF
jgi:predicted nuclease of predicted toxin-antitoxin system